ncbi:MAG: glycosyltransferase [Ileibacterium sp.]|nr:glycosyltransferase [Ileibacterium sp.]
MDLVSILVPMYNVAEFLPRCMEYLLAQTWPNIEIVLINDGSTDNTLQIAGSYAQKYDRVKLYSYPNGGISAARNRALSHALGDWIMFVDPDDYLEEEAVEHLIQEAFNNNLDIVQCGYRIDFKYFAYFLPSSGHKYVDSVEALHLMSRCDTFNQYPWGKLYARQTFEGIEFPEDVKMFEDAYTIFKTFINAGRVGAVSNRYYHYTQRSGSLTRNMSPENIYLLRQAYEYQIAYLKEKLPEEVFDYDVMNYNTDMLLIYLLVVNGKKEEEHLFVPGDIDWKNIPFAPICRLSYNSLLGIARLKLTDKILEKGNYD